MNLSALEYTGERMVPEAADRQTFWEHVYRYKFALPYAKGRRVLDIACGEGYGTASLLAAGAVSVLGVDVSAAACAHATRKYKVPTAVGDAQNIPVPDGSVDLVVSYETLEHVSDPGRFLDEIRRVLLPGGWVIISTPNKEVYLNGSGSNPYHCSEMSLPDFVAQLRQRFRSVRLYSQRPTVAKRFSSRSLVMKDSPLLRVPKVRGLRDRVRGHVCGKVFAPLEGNDSVRLDPIGTILQKLKLLDWALNPYFVRRAAWIDDRPNYYIAIAHR